MLAVQSKDFKTICPKCGGNDYSVTPSKGLTHCWHCDYATKDNNVASVQIKRSKYIKEIRELYTELSQIYHSNLRECDRQYLLARGITDQSIQKYKIGYCSEDILLQYKSRIAIEAGIAIPNDERKPFLANRIIFPYFVDNVVVELRGRTTINDDKRYSSPYRASFTRGSDYPYNYDTAYADTLVITESELKCIVANQCGYNAIGVPGINVWKRGYTPSAYQQAIICFDNTRKRSRYELHRAIEKIAAKFHSPKVATLPLRGKESIDLDEYVLEYGQTALRRVIDNALSVEEWRLLSK